MYMYICVYANIYIYIHLYRHVYIYTHIYVYLDAHIYMYIYESRWICRRIRAANSRTTWKAGWVGHLSQDFNSSPSNKKTNKTNTYSMPLYKHIHTYMHICVYTHIRGGDHALMCVETDTAQAFVPEGFGPETRFTSEQPSNQAVPHNRDVCCVAQQTSLLRHTADLSAVSHSNCGCCVTHQTCLLCPA